MATLEAVASGMRCSQMFWQRIPGIYIAGAGAGAMQPRPAYAKQRFALVAECC